MSVVSSRERLDVVIVGGGIIGCGLARELAGRGVSVAVVERGQPGEEASSAAAGMLAPQAEGIAPGPLLDLCLESRGLHAVWADELAAETGIDVGYRRCGILRCCFEAGGRLAEEFGWQAKAGLAIEPKDSTGITSLTEDRVACEVAEALFFPDEAIVDSARLTRALALSGERRGVRLLTGIAALKFRVRDGVCTGVETDVGGLEAERVVNAAGAWADFDVSLPFRIPVEPVRGQIVELELPGRELPTAVQDDRVYLVPRRGGRVLAGATVERVGYRKEVTAAAMGALVGAAMRLVPDLAEAAFVRAWAGLRPGTPDGSPILGRSPLPGLFLAAGHFRNGILLAPATARAMADLLTGGAGRELEPFSIARFDVAPVSADAAPTSPPSDVFG